MELVIIYLVSVIGLCVIELYDDLQRIGYLTLQNIVVTCSLSLIPIFNSMMFIAMLVLFIIRLIDDRHKLSDKLDIVVIRKK
jgi:hypothetical protein